MKIAEPLPEDLRLCERREVDPRENHADLAHQYLVRDRVDEQMFERMVKHIWSNGYEVVFIRRRLPTSKKTAWYWTMGAPLNETTIINRCLKEDSFEYRAAHGNLPASVVKTRECVACSPFITRSTSSLRVLSPQSKRCTDSGVARNSWPQCPHLHSI